MHNLEGVTPSQQSRTLGASTFAFTALLDEVKAHEPTEMEGMRLRPNMARLTDAAPISAPHSPATSTVGTGKTMRLARSKHLTGAC